MYVLSFVASLLASGCMLAPAGQQPAPSSTAQSAPALAGAEAFPEPKSGLTLTLAGDEDLTIEKLLDQFSKLTGHALLIAQDVRQVARATPTGLNRSVEVPAREVYSFVETLLAQNDFVLTVLSEREPRLLGVSSRTQGRGGLLLSQALQVPPERIAAYAQHPAVLVRTVVDLPNVDVRTLSNSMRALFTDASTQQIIPVGNSDSLVVIGLGREVANLVDVFRQCDERARIAEEVRLKERAKEKELDRQRRVEERKAEEAKGSSEQGEAKPAKQEKPN